MTLKKQPSSRGQGFRIFIPATPVQIRLAVLFQRLEELKQKAVCKATTTIRCGLGMLVMLPHACKRKELSGRQRFIDW